MIIVAPLCLRRWRQKQATNSETHCMYRFFTVTLITLLTAACTSAPQPPVAGESLPACGSFPNCVNSENGQGSAAVAPIAAITATNQPRMVCMNTNYMDVVRTDEGTWQKHGKKIAKAWQKA